MIIDLFSLLKAFGLNLKMDKQHPLKCGGSTYSPIKGTEDDFTTYCHCQNGVLSIHKLNRFVTSCYQSIRHCYSNGVHLYLDIHMIKRQYPYLWKDVGQEKAKVGPACHSEFIQKCFYVKLLFPLDCIYCYCCAVGMHWTFSPPMTIMIHRRCVFFGTKYRSNTSHSWWWKHWIL